MGLRGPAPTPTKVLQLRGTFRQDRHGDPASEPELELLTVLPKAPRFLGSAGRWEWHRIGPELIERGLLAKADLAAFAGYCASLSRAVDADNVIRLEGATMRCLQGEIARPEVAIARTSWAEVRKFAQEFGLTPSARRRVRVPAPAKPNAQPEQNPWDEVANG
jgi:P27 family predicted phage terminase small subunit